jgi:cyclase
MVLSIEAKRKSNNSEWEVYTDCGRESTDLDVEQWACQGVELGAGELLVTSIDQEGTRKGFDNELIHRISSLVEVPVIASGGFGENSHLQDIVQAGADAVAFADALHFAKYTLSDLRKIASEYSIPVRTES